MKQTFMPTVKNRAELEALQLEGLKWTIQHACQGSEFYRKKFREAGVEPGDISTLDDLSKLPFSRGPGVEFLILDNTT